MLYNISIICPIVSTNISNCYCVPARLFIIGGKELLSKKGTTQGDPTAMGVYALTVTPILYFLRDFIVNSEHDSKEVAFSDDFSVFGKVSEIKEYWEMLSSIFPKYGYFPKASESHRIVKQKHLTNSKELFADTEVQITTEGQRYLGAIIGSEEYKKTYVTALVDDRKQQLKTLAKIAETEPQAAYLH